MHGQHPWLIPGLGLLGAGALVLAYVLVPAAQGRPVLLAIGLGVAGLLLIVAALGATLPPRLRSLLGWSVFGICPLALLVWVATAGIPAGLGAVVLGAALCTTAVAGLWIAVREASG